MKPIAVTERFVEACTSGRRAEAQELCTDAGWTVSGESARRFFEQTTGTPLTVRPSGPLREHQDRAVLPAFIDIDETQHIWFLLSRQTETWQVDGTADGWDTAGLYAHGLIERPPAFSELPESELARHWFDAFDEGAELKVGPDGRSALELLLELKSTADAVRLVRTVGIPAARRHAAAIAFEQADGMTQTIWALLSGSDRGHIRLLGRSFAASTSQLVRGVDPEWPPKTSSGAAPRYTANEATDLFREALQAAHIERSEATGKDSPLGGRLGNVLTDLFETLIDPDQRPPAPDGSPAEQRLAASVSEAVRHAASTDQLDDEISASDLRIDSEFLRDNGGQLVSSLVSALTGALVPPDLSLDLGKADAGDSKKVRIDLGDLLGGLMQPTDDTDSQA